MSTYNIDTMHVLGIATKAVESKFELVRFLHELAIHYLLLADTYQTIYRNVFFLLYRAVQKVRHKATSFVSS